jgi:assimilatory nitrate reductase catalytic subunit
VNARTPFVLSTGRLRDHWHGMSRTGVTPAAFAHQPEPMLEMHPQDMEARFLKHGDTVCIRNARGQQIWRGVRANPALRSGMLWLPMHWGEEFVGVMQTVIPDWALTIWSVLRWIRSPFSLNEIQHGQPAKTFISYCLQMIYRADPDQIPALQRACRQLLRNQPYVECIPFGGTASGIALYACLQQAEPALFAALAEVAGLQQHAHLRYQDPQRSTRLIRLENRQLHTVMQTGNQTLPDWLIQWLKEAKEITVPASLLLQDKAPAGIPVQRNVQVCQCLGVSAAQITQYLEQQETPATPEAEQAVLLGLQATSAMRHTLRFLCTGAETKHTGIASESTACCLNCRIIEKQNTREIHLNGKL